MADDKRRRARVQGGWAANTPASSSRPIAGAVKATSPSWLTQSNESSFSGAGAASAKLTFQAPESIVIQSSQKRVIDKTGVYNISDGPHGVSRLRLTQNFIEASDCGGMLQQLLDELPWRQEIVQRPGREETIQPRLTAWFGDLPYSYSGITHDTNIGWTSLLLSLKQHIEKSTGLVFNSLLANLYRDGHDWVAWHSDDEPLLGPSPTIASLSFGDTRNFELRRKPPPGVDVTQFVYNEFIKVPLDAGSLLIMEGATQHDWQHSVPREYHDRRPRVNLTFRVILPE